IIQEWGEIYRIPALNNGIVATVLAVGCCLLLAFGAGGTSGTGGMIIWPLFGTTNQILAGLTLLVISVMLIKLGRPVYYTMIPMLFVLTMAFFAGCITLVQFFVDGNYLLVGLDVIVLITSLLVMLEAGSVIMRYRSDKAGVALPD
ncbi:MAG: carbon starvation CstA 5TM domain-containing protein, partial [Pseudomonadales bacterium]